jgi:tetratricopeptide (TPR) repeat protein
MTEQEINKSYSEICRNLEGRKLKPAFDMLGKLIADNNLGVFNDEYRNLEETYHFMLKYTVEGIQDPERQKVYRKLIVSVFELAENVNQALRTKFSPSIEYEKKRLFKNQYISNLETYISELEDFYLDHEIQSIVNNQAKTNSDKMTAAREHQQKMFRLFYHVWFRDKLQNGEKETLTGFFTNPLSPVAYRSFVITAVTLSLQRYFDEAKFSVLFEAYASEEPEVSQRALVGLLINFYRYDARLPFYPAITGRLKILNEDPAFKKNIERIIVQFIRSKETEKIQRKIRDEIIPEMIRISPNFKDKINLDSLMEEGLDDDKNPEWEEIFKDSPGLMDKMEEFSELQMEGADVFMGSFSMLKSFPFFNEIGNWFIPFYTENPSISNVVDTNDETNRKFVEVISSAPILCNSDKYSFCFSMQNLPEQNREFLAKGMEAEMGQLEELGKDEELVSPGRKAEFISNQYIQDLYRFFKLHPRKNDFEDIFNWRFDFHNKIALGNILKEDSKVLRNIAEYYFAKNHFEEAAEIYNYLLEEKKDGELYQKVAYCYQKLGDFEKALDAYLKAELYDLNRLWNLKKIALCYRNLKQPAKALEYYQAAEKLDPESLNNQLNIGHCYLELEQFEEALKCYFKVEYLAPGNKKVWRPIAWCSFLSGKKEQSEKYFMKVIDDAPGKHDFMNMGHVQWSLGKRKDALDYYKKSISEAGFSEPEFLEVFEEDLPHLVKQGIDSEDVPIMLDQLRYFLEE